MNNRVRRKTKLTDEEYLTLCAQDAENRNSDVLRKAAGFQIDHIDDPAQLDRLIAYAMNCRKSLTER